MKHEDKPRKQIWCNLFKNSTCFQEGAVPYLVIILSTFLPVLDSRWTDAVNTLTGLSWVPALQSFESSGSLLCFTKQQQIASGLKSRKLWWTKRAREEQRSLLINEFGPTLCLPHPARLRLRPPVYALFYFKTPTDFQYLSKVSQLIKLFSCVALSVCVVAMIRCDHWVLPVWLNDLKNPWSRRNSAAGCEFSCWYWYLTAIGTTFGLTDCKTLHHLTAY